jgi:hypothetical protein
MTGMTLRQIDTWVFELPLGIFCIILKFIQFQNKRCRTRKSGRNAAGQVVYDMENVPTLEDLIEELGSPTSEVQYDLDVSEDSSDEGTDVSTLEPSETEYEIVYESSSDDAVRILYAQLEHSINVYSRGYSSATFQRSHCPVGDGTFLIRPYHASPSRQDIPLRVNTYQPRLS